MEKYDVFERDNFYVLTGGPGVGKTTLLEELETYGYEVVPEVAREIIRQQMETDGEGLPWKNREFYTTLMLNGSIESYLNVCRNATGKTVFFDRGIPDTYCYANMIGMAISEDMEKKAFQYRYNKNVFLLPAWKEIYETDTERKQDWDEAVYTYEMMKKTYREYNYNVIEVPKDSVGVRAEFILNQIKADFN